MLQKSLIKKRGVISEYVIQCLNGLFSGWMIGFVELFHIKVEKVYIFT